MLVQFQKRHDYVVHRLNGMPGIDCLSTDGTFYVFPSVTGLIDAVDGVTDDLQLAEHLIEHAGVALVPGTAFGLSGHAPEPPRVERHLCAGPNYQPIILIPVGDNHMGLDMCLLNFRHFIRCLDNFIGFRKPFFNITDINVNLCRQIAIRIRVSEGHIFCLIVNPGSALLQSIAHIEDDWKFLILHINQLQRLFSDLLGFCRDQCDPIADKAHFTV